MSALLRNVRRIPRGGFSLYLEFHTWAAVAIDSATEFMLDSCSGVYDIVEAAARADEYTDAPTALADARPAEISLSIGSCAAAKALRPAKMMAEVRMLLIVSVGVKVLDRVIVLCCNVFRCNSPRREEEI